jgi:hypothetical protein
MPGGQQMLANSRCHRFGQVIGLSTLEPNRAMQFNLLEGRPDEGYDRDAVVRNMGMCASWAQSESSNFLTVALNQLETLRLHLSVLGLWDSRSLVDHNHNLLLIASDFTTQPGSAVPTMRAALDEWYDFASYLDSCFGADVTNQLVPDCGLAIQLADQCLTALQQGDRDTLIRMTDLAKKEYLVERYLEAQWGGWSEHRHEIRNICFAFASPQALSPYYTFFRPNGLERIILDENDLRHAGPDSETRSWFFGQVLKRFSDDPDFDCIAWDWDRLTIRRPVTLSGGWIPNIRVDHQVIRLPASVGHNEAASGNTLDQVNTLAELFETFGSTAWTQSAIG